MSRSGRGTWAGQSRRLVRHEFHSFAAEIGADLPPRARQVADERSRAQALIGPVEAD